MENLSFEIKTCADFYNKLVAEYADFKSNRLSSRFAVNFAMTAFHLVDWVYHKNNKSHQSQTLHQFTASLKELCPALQIVHDITNGTKHAELTRHQPKVEATTKRIGAFSMGFGNGFAISRLEVKMKDGSHMDFSDVAEQLVSFWREYLTETGVIKTVLAKAPDGEENQN